MNETCIYCGREFEAESEGVLFHNIRCFYKYRNERIIPIYKRIVKYNALLGEGARSFNCIHYDMCLDGVILRIESARRSKQGNQKAWETWHCPIDCIDFE